MKFMSRIVLAGLFLAIVLPHAKAADKFDWIPPQLGEQDLDAQSPGDEQIIPEIVITDTPKPTADMSKYTKTYVIELKKFNISNEGTNPVETSKGINAALQYAKTLDVNQIVFPKGTYLISETEPVTIDHKNTVIDFNGATLQMNPNGLKKYSIVDVIDGAENIRITNGTLRGDKDKHDYSLEGVHAWGHCIIFHGGRNIEADHLIATHGTGDGANTRTGRGKVEADNKHKIIHEIFLKDVEQGGFSDKGVKIDNAETTRTIKPCDITKSGGQFEFGYTTHYMGYPYIKSRIYQAYFYDKDMKYIGMKKCLQFRKTTVPQGAAFVNLEFNQPEISEEPAHIAAKDGFIGRITNYTPPTDVHFHHNTLTGNSRLGLAYCGGVRWLIEENLFEANGPTRPAYGIDFEDGMELMQDVVVRNNRFKDNDAGDLVICAGSELIIEDNVFEKNVLVWARPHNYIFRNNKYTGKGVRYTTRTGVAKIHDNTYENCTVSILFDTKGVADGLYRKPGEALVTPPLTLENETMTNVSKVTGTYFNFKNAVLENTHFVAGEQTRMVNFEDCEFNDVSLEYKAEGPEVYVIVENCKGEIKEQGPGLVRKKPVE